MLTSVCTYKREFTHWKTHQDTLTFKTSMSGLTLISLSVVPDRHLHAMDQ